MPGRVIETCPGLGRSFGNHPPDGSCADGKTGPHLTIVAVAGAARPARLAVLVPLLLFLVLPAGAPAAWAKPGPASDFDSKLAANYLAGLHAEHTQDYASASEFFRPRLCGRSR